MKPKDNGQPTPSEDNDDKLQDVAIDKIDEVRSILLEMCPECRQTILPHLIYMLAMAADSEIESLGAIEQSKFYYKEWAEEMAEKERNEDNAKLN